MKSAIAKALETPEPETENIFQNLLKQPSKKKDPTVEALEARDNKALRARVNSLEQQNKELLRRMEAMEMQLKMKEDAEKQAKAFVPTRHGHPWSHGERNELRFMWQDSNRSIAEIAAYFKRSERAIEMALEQMGFIWEQNYNIHRNLYEGYDQPVLQLDPERRLSRKRRKTCC